MAYQRPGARVIASEFEWQTVGRCVLRALHRLRSERQRRSAVQ
jgi:hypothetical protein